MTDIVEAAFDVAFENPLRIGTGKNLETVLDRVGTVSSGAKPIRTEVRKSFGNRIQRKQI